MAREISRGMWAKHGANVGIVGPIAEGAAEFHVTHPESGDTVGVVANVPLSELVQAGYGDIPTARRPPSDVAAKFGYV